MKFCNLFENVLSREQIKSVLTSEVKDLGKLFSNNGYELRIVGGAVRDLLLGKKPKDIDFCSDAQPTEMISFLEEAGWRVIPTGLQHGTISVVGSEEEPYEITTLRIDVETDGRHAEVEFTRDFFKDAERRDLTFNAMSISMDGKIYDYFDGIRDLKKGIARFVGDPAKRIQEDYLRILRYFRFQGRMSTVHFDRSTLNAIRNNANGLTRISGERIWAEMQKILTGSHVENLVKMMCELSVAKYANIPCNFAGIDQILNVNPVSKLAFLTSNIEEANTIINRWKLSNKEKELFVWLVDNKNTNIDLVSAKKMVSNGVSSVFLYEYYMLHKNNQFANAILKWNIPSFPVTGKDLIDLGVKPGPGMGNLLRDLKVRWQESGYELKRTELLSMVKI